MPPDDPTPNSDLKNARTKDGHLPKAPEGHGHHPHSIVQRGQVAHLEETTEQPEPQKVVQKETLHSTADQSE
jgi:hypothetical protein